MKSFYAEYRCGKAIDLVSVGKEGTLFAGRRVVQHRDYHFTFSMDEYVKAKLRPIEVPKGLLVEYQRGDAHKHQRSQWRSWLVGISGKTRHGSDSLYHSF